MEPATRNLSVQLKVQIKRRRIFLYSEVAIQTLTCSSLIEVECRNKFCLAPLNQFVRPAGKIWAFVMG